MVFFLGLALLAPASLEGQAKPAAHGHIAFPLIPGSNWHYEVQFDSGGGPTPLQYRVSCRRDRRWGMDEKRAYTLETTRASGRRRREVLQVEYYEVQDDGAVVCTQRDNGPIAVAIKPPQVLLPGGPLKVGQAWEWKGRYAGRPAESSSKILRREKVKILGEERACWVVEVKTTSMNSNLRRVLWLADGLGLARESTISLDPKAQLKLEGACSQYYRPKPAGQQGK